MYEFIITIMPEENEIYMFNLEIQTFSGKVW